jgi:putative ABC transport system permease protein
MSGVRPPRLAVWLLDRALRGSVEREALFGDLMEEYHHRRRERDGVAGANRWFWRETILALTVARPRRDPSPDPSGEPFVFRFLSDVRSGARLLRSVPMFTGVCVLTLALGIGATTAMYSVVDPILMQPLPYPDPERVMLVWERDDDGSRSNTSFATYRDLADGSTTLAAAAAVGSWAPTIADNGEPERLTGDRVSWSYFDVLGVRPTLGRGFVRDHDAPGENRVIVIAHTLWMRRFGGDSSIIRRSVALDGIPHEVVGVMPRSFENVLSPNAEIWRVLGYDASQPWACRTCRHIRMIARLRAGIDPQVAREELNARSASLVRQYPTDYSAPGIHLVSLHDEVTRASRPTLLVLAAAVGLLLMLATANVANLQLTRALRRDHELAVRAALGAGRGRLTQQLLAEGLVLALLGGVAGVLVARAALPALLAQLPQGLPRLDAVRLDPGALGVAAALTLTLAVVIGLAPAWRGGRANVGGALRDGARLAGSRRHVARSALVAAEVALALVLLAGAGLLARSLSRLMARDPGFNPRGVLALDVQATGSAYETADDVYANHDRLIASVATLPGVRAVGITSQLPLGGNLDMYGIQAEDRPLANPALAPSADRYVVSQEFMNAMRIPLIRGRPFTRADHDSASKPVVIVSAALAERIWGTQDAIGKRIRMGGPTRPWREIVGIAGNVRHSSLDTDLTQQVYVPERQWIGPDNQVTLVVRTDGDAAALTASVRRAVRDVDPAQPITRVATMEQILATSTANRRLALVLFGAFSFTALVMAAAGIYGVLAGSVIERTREIGVRTALGATPGRILALVLSQGARLIIVGLGAGLVGALALGQVLRSLLFGVAPNDPPTLAAVTGALAVVALLACLVPVLRALRVDPVTALRAE